MMKAISARRARPGAGRLAGAVLLALATVTVGVAPAQARTQVRPAFVPQPDPVIYGTSQPVTASITMNDGVVLSAQVVYPTNPVTGARAPGNFPVLLTQNPYGTAISNPLTPGTYYVDRGYIYVAASVRGSGTSGGQLDWIGTSQGQDGAALVNWAAHSLSGSNGNVGLDGCSYLGVDQWYTAAAVGANSALKAIAPFCTDSEMYNDITTVGGVPSAFIPALSQVLPRGPQDNAQTDPLSTTVNDLNTGGARSYYNDYWHGINQQELMPKVVANGVPALSEAGWNDLFPGGAIGDYTAAQNAFFGRPVTAPITAGEPVTGRYQAIVGPWTHAENTSGDVLNELKEAWFDTWLKGSPTGMADTTTPLHIFENNATRWVDTAAWPPAPSTGTYYLNNAGSLTATPPTTAGTDNLYYAFPWFPATYNSPALSQDRVLDGPIDVSLYVTSTTPDALVAATVNLVAPTGAVTKLGDGSLLASMRALDTQQSWFGTGNTLIKPVHPFTQASQSLLKPNQTVKMDISVLPNFTLIPAGDRLQVVLSSQAPSNFHLPLTPTPQQTANLNFGQFTLSHAAQTASSITLPLASPGAFTTSPVNWGPSS
jgi:predicted acyl esterase